jgi:hypothetical protein
MAMSIAPRPSCLPRRRSAPHPSHKPHRRFEGGYLDAYKRGANVVPMPIDSGSIDVTGRVTVIFGLKPR